MNESFDIYEKIEQYCLDLMDEHERFYFESEINQNPALAKAVHEYQILLNTFDHQQNSHFIHSSLDQLHRENRSHTDVLINQLTLHIHKYWRTATVAASVAFIASILTFTVARNVYKKDTRAQYLTLRNEINSIKKDQTSIKNEFNKVKETQINIPDYPSKYTGTAFAISRNGYIVTNYHVIEGGSKIFVFTADNTPHSAQLVAKDPTHDLAILRIVDSGFSFGNRVPYSLRKSAPGIAQRIYSLGYPKSDIVYSEGYISSITGFEGDTIHYQLELPSGPGVSGAPVIDESGNIIGIISGKQSHTSGVTFAVKAKSLLEMCKDLQEEDFTPYEIQNNELFGMNRPSQVKKITPYVCLVKVYN